MLAVRIRNLQWQSFISFQLWQLKPHGCNSKIAIKSECYWLVVRFLFGILLSTHCGRTFVESTSSAKQTYMRLKRTQNEDNDCDVNKYCGCFTVNLFSHFIFFFLCFPCGFFLLVVHSHFQRFRIYESQISMIRIRIRISHSIPFDLHLCRFFVITYTTFVYSLNTYESTTISHFFLSVTVRVFVF